MAVSIYIVHTGWDIRQSHGQVWSVHVGSVHWIAHAIAPLTRPVRGDREANTRGASIR